MDQQAREAVQADVATLVEPWSDYHGDLPDCDHPLRCVFESGVQYAVELLAKRLKVDDWEPCDGTEEYDGDLGGTMMNIVLAAMPEDEHGDPIYPRDLPAALSTTSEGGAVEALSEAKTPREIIEHVAMVAHAIGWQAGVGGSETAGVIISYLANHPEAIDPFLAGEQSLLDWGDDLHRSGCLSWLGADGKVWTPEAARAALAKATGEPA